MSGIACVICSNKELKKQPSQMIKKVLHRGGEVLEYSDKNLSLQCCVKTKNHEGLKHLGKYIFAFDGEIYNRNELNAHIDTSKKTDEEIFIHLFDKFGINCMDKINGVFAYILIDIKNNKVFCAKDRFGVKPLYYSTIDGNLYFASEIKQFTAIDGFKAIGNLPRIKDFLLYGITDYSKQTMFADVFRINGGEYLELDLTSSNFELKKWYNLRERIKPLSIEFDEAKQIFRDLLTNSIEIRLAGEKKIGALLSGGLDSSAIVCVANDILKGKKKLETVSACFEEEHVSEIEYINAVVEKTGVISHKTYPGADGLLGLLEELAYQLDEPYASTSIYAQYSAYEEAKNRGLEVMLDGQGSDEMLAGYVGHVHNVYFNELNNKKETEILAKNIEGYKKYYGREVDLAKIKRLSLIKKLLPLSFLRKIRMLFSKKRRTETSFIKIKGDKVAEQTVLKPVANLLEDSLITFNYSSIPVIFRYEDRDSTIHGVDYRVPFCDHRLVEFVLSLPSEFKIHNAKTKYIMREALKDMMPQKITTRYNKIGFESPEDVWIRDNKEIFRNELEFTCDAMGRYLDKHRVLNWFDSILESGQKFRYEFWKIISLGKWIKAYNVDFEGK